MKKIFMIWIAISVVMTTVFGFTFMSKSYFDRFSDFPDFMSVFNNLMNSWNGISISFHQITDLITFFQAIGSVFGFIFYCLELPFELIGYVIDVISFILPFNLTSGGVSV